MALGKVGKDNGLEVFECFCGPETCRGKSRECGNGCDICRYGERIVLNGGKM